MRRMKLNKAVLVWLCKRFKEASDIKGKSFKTWRGRDRTTHVYCSLSSISLGDFCLLNVNGQLMGRKDL